MFEFDLWTQWRRTVDVKGRIGCALGTHWGRTGKMSICICIFHCRVKVSDQAILLLLKYWNYLLSYNPVILEALLRIKKLLFLVGLPSPKKVPSCAFMTNNSPEIYTLVSLPSSRCWLLRQFSTKLKMGININLSHFKTPRGALKCIILVITLGC